MSNSSPKLVSENSVPSVDKLTEAPDPFDVEKLRISQDFLETAGVKKLITTVPVRRPGKQEFFRVHPSEKYRAPLAGIDLRDDMDREFYLLTPSIAGAVPEECISATLHTAITRQGTLFLWPIRLPGSDGRDNEWWRSARAAAAQAVDHWIRIRANHQLKGYEVSVAIQPLPEPEWPELDFNGILRVAFRDRLINNLDHQVLKRLRGEC